MRAALFLTIPLGLCLGLTKSDKRFAWPLFGVAFAVLWALMVTGVYAAESPTQFFVGQQPQSYAVHGTIRIWRKRHRVWREQTVSRPNPVSIFAGDVVAEFRRHLGQGNFTGRPGPWCAYAASAVLVATGHRPLASGMASSALRYGSRLSAPRVGALAVLPGHVGIVEAVEGDRVTMLSGNWSHRVSRAVLPRRAFAAFVAIP